MNTQRRTGVCDCDASVPTYTTSLQGIIVPPLFLEASFPLRPAGLLRKGRPVGFCEMTI